MTNRDVEDQLRQVRWPTPSSDLRARVMNAAPRAVERVSWSDRIWFSRAWRLSTLAATVALVLCAQLIDSRPAIDATPASVLTRMATIEDIAEDAGLPASDAHALAQHLMTATATPMSSFSTLNAFDDVNLIGAPR